MTIYTPYFISSDSKKAQSFQPTWLYIKTHNITGLKYLGKTCEIDPDEYEGSGTRWTRHINVHGYDVTTELIASIPYTDAEDCNIIALFLSWYWNIVDSNDWANLIPENGLHGGGVKGRKHSKESRERIRKENIRRVEEGLCPFSAREDGTSVGGDTSKARVLARTHNLLRREDGTSVTSDRYASGMMSPFATREDGTSVTRDRITNGTFMSPFLSETFVNPNLKRADGSSLASDRVEVGLCPLQTRPDGTSVTSDRTSLGLNPWQHQVKKECPHCHRWFNPGMYTRWHGDKCKLNQAALDSDIKSYLITDCGLTEFGGIPTPTCVAIGPDWSDRIKPLVEHLKLY